MVWRGRNRVQVADPTRTVVDLLDDPSLGANRLCVELRYGGKVRVIEPYSLRRTRDGHLLLHAVRADNRGHRSYRLDRIQGVRVTSRAFRPVYAVEFAPAGPISAPQASPSTSGTWSSSGRTNRVYRVQCTTCRKIFTRTRPGNEIREHKDPEGWPCPGRSGFSLSWS